MNKHELAELAWLHKEAFMILNQIPSHEKERCIESMFNYLARMRPIKELRDLKQRPFNIQWKVCMMRIIHQQAPFKGYNAELAVSVG